MAEGIIFCVVLIAENGTTVVELPTGQSRSWQRLESAGVMANGEKVEK
uniref:Uncharacterized protein n=1 Tax=Salmonella sp. TaxID=599 RepID=A0A482EW35_SALSP|nr:hypothetical protein NNIBIDOC_00140 [Salmonella sp.]